MDRDQLEKIWKKTDGHCHFCGKKLIFSSYGPKGKPRGKWQVDHIYPRARGGLDSAKNYLPICRACNRLRWHFTGTKIRKLFRYGLIAFRNVRQESSLGRKLRELYRLRNRKNRKRRKAQKR